MVDFRSRKTQRLALVSPARLTRDETKKAPDGPGLQSREETLEEEHSRTSRHYPKAGDVQSKKGLRHAGIDSSYRPYLSGALPARFIEPCLPTKTDNLPSGSQWLHEIKHDGFRIIARKTGAQVRLYSRPGNDLTHRFPLIVETLARLRYHSCIIDGEAVACDDNGVASFDLIRYRRHHDSTF